MSKYSRSKVEAILSQGRIALNNARDTPEILDLLSSFNYDEAKLEEGQVLFKDLRIQHEAQVRLRALASAGSLFLSCISCHVPKLRYSSGECFL